MQKINDMSVFVAVIENMNMTRAGEILGMSSAVVSKRILNLEKRLGVRLLNRSTRRMTPTEEGTIYYHRCKTILEEIENTELALSGMQKQPKGILKISAPASFGRKHISPILTKFLSMYPDVDLQIQLTDKVVDILEEGLDMAIRIGHLDDSNLVARKLSPNCRVLCASHQYLQQFGTPQSPQDLSHHSCLLLGAIGTTHQSWSFTQDKQMTKVRVQGRIVSNNGEVLRDGVLGGLGIAQKSTWDVGEDLKNGTIVRVLPDYSLGQTDIYALYPHRLHLSSKVRVWVDFLVDHFGPTPYWD